MSDQACSIDGIGVTRFSRNSERSAQALAIEALLSAASDADTDVRDIDALVMVGSSVRAEDLMSSLSLRDVEFNLTTPVGGSAATASLGVAEALLRSGKARRVAVVLGRNGASESRISNRVTTLAGQQFREHLERPAGWVTPAQWYAMICRRHMIEYGTTKRDLAAVALTMREHAHQNPRAMMHGRQLTLAMYEAAPVVADPYQLFDCSLETDGGVALLLSLGHGGSRAVQVAACRAAQPSSPDDLVNRENWFDVGLTTAAPRAFADASLEPSDIDAAMIYDCFTFEVIHQLEEAGFCDRGTGGRFVSAGNIGMSGSLPVNPHGGLLSEGHLSGMNHIVEAVVQLRGEAAGRQISRARHVAVTGWGDLGDGSLAILRRQ